jgi:predicted transcriptional regulator of viral defense system
MGKIVYLNKIREFIKSVPVFRVRDVEIIVGNRNYAHLILYKLEKKGEIKRVTKGWYSIYEDPIFSVFCFKPSYIGLYEALSLHNLWEQETNVVIITARKIRSGIRKIFENNVILKRIEPKYLFGYDFINYRDSFIPVSDIEKTLIDFLYFKEKIPKETAKELIRKIDKKKVYEYLKKYPNSFRKKVKKFISKFS